MKFQRYWARLCQELKLPDNQREGESKKQLSLNQGGQEWKIPLLSTVNSPMLKPEWFPQVALRNKPFLGSRIHLKRYLQEKLEIDFIFMLQDTALNFNQNFPNLKNKL